MPLDGVTRIPGVLRGVDGSWGAGAMCTLEVWTELSSRGRRIVRCRISDAPAELPDGAYRLEFAGHGVVTNKYEGAWELTFLWPQFLRELEKRRGAA